MLVGCSSDDDDGTPEGTTDPTTEAGGEASGGGSGIVSGFTSLSSVRSVPETIGELQSAIAVNDAVTEVATVDHQANAATADETLRPTSVTSCSATRCSEHH